MIRILKYVKATLGRDLIYEDKGHTQTVGYSNVNWARYFTNRCSTYGYCLLIGGNLISYKSNKQNVVIRSRAEIECRAMASANC